MNAAASWPRWSAEHQPGSLIQYVQREAAAHYLGSRVPGPSGDPPAVRARALYEAFAARDIQYVDEPSSSETGLQAIRPPHEVLQSPRHGTCLDLAVTFAGACLYAGLHPLIVVLPPARPGAPAHTVVAVRLYGGWSGRPDVEYRSDEAEPAWDALPADFLRELADDQDSPGSYLAIDITGVSSRARAAEVRRRQQLSWEDAVAYGTELLRGTEPERWIVALDVGMGLSVNEAYPLPYRPSTDLLTPPYVPIDGETGPLQQLWARHDVIRFLPRDELDFLQDWFQAPDPDEGPRTRIALLHGQGGAGKTRLAAELASRLSHEGWYAGFLVRSPDPRDLSWLGHVASPLLVVVDYVEDAKSSDVVNLLRAVRRRTEPTCLILTARTVSGWWEEIAGALRHEAHPYVLENRPLRPRHPRQNDVYRAALHSFGGPQSVALAGTPPPDPNAGRWTTLDLVMLGWLAARQDGGDLPESEEGLYEEILRHELNYWKRSYRAQVGKPSESLLRAVGACISLLAPRADRLSNALKAVEDLAEDAKWRREVAELFVELLPVTPEDGTLAVRPDPVGSHLAAGEFGSDQRLLRRCLEQADEHELLNACVGLSRVSASSGAELATGLASAALNDVHDLWAPALAVAATQGGPFVRALERVAESEENWLPLAELAATLPMGNTNLRRLALIATQRSAPQGPGDGTEEALAARASWLNNLAVRQNESGEREAALVSATEAVRHWRGLAEADADTYLPDLAMALNNLAVQQSETGDRQTALTTTTEAIQHYRTLTKANPAAYLPNLADALNNLAVQQNQVGNRQAALATATEAIDLYRGLAEADAATYLPHLATGLANLANHQSQTGDIQAALTTATEAVHHYRTLTQANPAAFLPGLAMALNNLANRQSQTGNRQAALTTANEAVHRYRTLTQANPAAFLPDLARALNNLANHQSQTGDRQGALITATEAVHHYRTLTQANPAAYLPNLATALSNLASHQSQTGDTQAALTTVTEAVTIRRTLTEANPAAYLPDLAMALNNLANQQSQTGDTQAALTTVTEAVHHHRTLTRVNPAAYLPNLATALNNLAVQQSETGDRQAALTTANEAVQHYRTLTEANPAAYLPDLAMALNNLANHQSQTGDTQGALTTATEAVQHYRTLTQANPAAYLPNLATALNNLANQHRESTGMDAAIRALDTYLTGLAAGMHAELLAFRATWRLTAGDPEGAVDDLLLAALRAEEEEKPERAGRARRATRACFSNLADDTAADPALGRKRRELPPWATATLTPEIEDVFAKWRAADDWNEQETLLREAYPLLRSDTGQAHLRILEDLNPESIRLRTLISILGAGQEHGLDKVLQDIRTARERQDLVSRWLDTPTWNEDLAFLMEHRERLCTDPGVRELLGSEEDDGPSLQHLGILELADRLPLHDVYDAITDPLAAVDTAMDLLDQGDVDALLPLFLAAPSIQRTSFVAPYLHAVYSALFLSAADSGPDAPDPAQLMTDAAAQGSDVQRGAGVARLRRLARRRPEHAAVLTGLADTLATAPSISPADQSVPDAE
ncbi:hypothetical protein STAFG_5497 [Streptomyces afghaniensis 772]|uniref:Tetratricopeptide repeat protein n=1 Tax=Streptomyces afghaniensis 772 TaxID=1283301 RepID=S4NGE4_9ACTN|nr:tetratricopeptide repeat protein [Streptomyces afghaniensis]EPJ37454.1 hypothetical protein STAFG_5497 [Streptomyces afghaniensis 772]